MFFRPLAVLELVNCCFAEPYDRISFLAYPVLLQATIKFENKHRAGVLGLFLFSLHNWELCEIPEKKRLRLYVSIHEWWRNFKPCYALRLLTSPMFLYLKNKHADGYKRDAPALRRHLYCVAVADHCFMVLMSFLTRTFLHVIWQFRTTQKTIFVCGSAHVVTFCCHCLGMCTSLSAKSKFET